MKYARLTLMAVLALPSVAFALDEQSLSGCDDPLPMFTGSPIFHEHLKYDASRWKGPPVKRFAKGVACVANTKDDFGTCPANGRRMEDEYVYDREGRLLAWRWRSVGERLTYPEGSRYPSLGLYQVLGPVVEPKSQTNYVRDEQGRVVRREIVTFRPSGQNESKVTTFEYLELGRDLMVRERSDEGTPTLRWYRDGRLSRIVRDEYHYATDPKTGKSSAGFAEATTQCLTSPTASGRSIIAMKSRGGEEFVDELILLDKDDRQIGRGSPGYMTVRRPVVRVDRYGNPLEASVCKVDPATKREVGCETTYYSYEYF